MFHTVSGVWELRLMDGQVRKWGEKCSARVTWSVMFSTWSTSCLWATARRGSSSLLSLPSRLQTLQGLRAGPRNSSAQSKEIEHFIDFIRLGSYLSLNTFLSILQCPIYPRWRVTVDSRLSDAWEIPWDGCRSSGEFLRLLQSLTDLSADTWQGLSPGQFPREEWSSCAAFEAEEGLAVRGEGQVGGQELLCQGLWRVVWQGERLGPRL